MSALSRRDASLPVGASEAPPVKLRIVPPAPPPAARAPAGAPAHPPRVGGRQLVGYLGMVLGMFMAILDIQIVSSSISEIQAGVSASADEISWVQTAYLIAEVVMIPL